MDGDDEDKKLLKEAAEAAAADVAAVVAAIPPPPPRAWSPHAAALKGRAGRAGPGPSPTGGEDASSIVWPYGPGAMVAHDGVGDPFASLSVASPWRDEAQAAPMWAHAEDGEPVMGPSSAARARRAASRLRDASGRASSLSWREHVVYLELQRRHAAAQTSGAPALDGATLTTLRQMSERVRAEQTQFIEGLGAVARSTAALHAFVPAGALAAWSSEARRRAEAAKLRFRRYYSRTLTLPLPAAPAAASPSALLRREGVRLQRGSCVRGVLPAPQSECRWKGPAAAAGVPIAEDAVAAKLAAERGATVVTTAAALAALMRNLLRSRRDCWTQHATIRGRGDGRPALVVLGDELRCEPALACDLHREVLRGSVVELAREAVAARQKALQLGRGGGDAAAAEDAGGAEVALDDVGEFPAGVEEGALQGARELEAAVGAGVDVERDPHPSKRARLEGDAGGAEPGVAVQGNVRYAVWLLGPHRLLVRSQLSLALSSSSVVQRERMVLPVGRCEHLSGGDWSCTTADEACSWWAEATLSGCDAVLLGRFRVESGVLLHTAVLDPSALVAPKTSFSPDVAVQRVSAVLTELSKLEAAQYLVRHEASRGEVSLLRDTDDSSGAFDLHARLDTGVVRDLEGVVCLPEAKLLRDRTRIPYTFPPDPEDVTFCTAYAATRRCEAFEKGSCPFVHVVPPTSWPGRYVFTVVTRKPSPKFPRKDHTFRRAATDGLTEPRVEFAMVPVLPHCFSFVASGGTCDQNRECGFPHLDVNTVLNQVAVDWSKGVRRAAAQKGGQRGRGKRRGAKTRGRRRSRGVGRGRGGAGGGDRRRQAGSSGAA